MIRALSVPRVGGTSSGRVAVRLIRRVSTLESAPLCSCLPTVNGAVSKAVCDGNTCARTQEKEEHLPKASFLYYRSHRDILCRQCIRRVQISALP